MIFSDIPGITRDASKYVQRALMMDLDEAEGMGHGFDGYSGGKNFTRS